MTELSDEINVSEIKSIKVKLFDQAGGKSVTANLPANILVARLIPILVQKMGFPTNVRYSLYHKEEQSTLKESDTLAWAGVKEGDTLRLLPEIFAGPPWHYFRRIQLVDAVLTSRLDEKSSKLKGLIFYSNSEPELRALVRTRSDQFISDFLPRPFLVIEEPSPKLKTSFCSKLGDLYDLYAEKVVSRDFPDYGSFPVKATDPKSYLTLSLDQLFRVGQEFGILPEQFPCLLLFKSISDKSGWIFELNRFIDRNKPDLQEQYRSFFYMLVTNILIADCLPDYQAMKYIQDEMTKWMTECGYPVIPIEKFEMRASIIEAIAATINLLDQ